MKKLFLATLVLLSACGDTSRIVAPPETASKTAYDQQGLTVRGQTIGPGGGLWYTTGGYSLCGSNRIPLVWMGDSIGVTMETKCTTSGFSAPTPHTYDGGIVNVYVESDNGFVFLGWVSSDLSKMGETYTAPAGARVRLDASVNMGCVIDGWQTDRGDLVGDPVDVPADVTTVTANFVCID
jgi:hypothetical protein